MSRYVAICLYRGKRRENDENVNSISKQPAHLGLTCSREVAGNKGGGNSVACPRVDGGRSGLDRVEHHGSGGLVPHQYR